MTFSFLFHKSGKRMIWIINKDVFLRVKTKVNREVCPCPCVVRENSYRRSLGSVWDYFITHIIRVRNSSPWNSNQRLAGTGGLVAITVWPACPSSGSVLRLDVNSQEKLHGKLTENLLLVTIYQHGEAKGYFASNWQNCHLGDDPESYQMKGGVNGGHAPPPSKESSRLQSNCKVAAN